MSMLIPDLYKPIRNMGYFFSITGICGFFVLFTKLYDVDHFPAVFLFVGSVSLCHLLLGIGIIVKNRRIFGLFKGYLRLGFPIGTSLSRRTLDYIDKNNIERYLK